MAGVFDFDIDDGMRRVEEPQSDDDEDIEIQEDFINGPDIRAMNESIIREPGAESLVISEFTFRGKAGKAGPAGNDKDTSGFINRISGLVQLLNYIRVWL